MKNFGKNILTIAAITAASYSPLQAQDTDLEPLIQEIIDDFDKSKLQIEIKSNTLSSTEIEKTEGKSSIKELNNKDLIKIHQYYSSLEVSMQAAAMERYAFIWAIWQNSKTEGEEESNILLTNELKALKLNKKTDLAELNKDQIIQICTNYLNQIKKCQDYSWKDEMFQSLRHRIKFIISNWKKTKNIKKLNLILMMNQKLVHKKK